MGEAQSVADLTLHLTHFDGFPIDGEHDLTEVKVRAATHPDVRGTRRGVEPSTRLRRRQPKRKAQLPAWQTCASGAQQRGPALDGGSSSPSAGPAGMDADVSTYGCVIAELDSVNQNDA